MGSRLEEELGYPCWGALVTLAVVQPATPLHMHLGGSTDLSGHACGDGLWRSKLRHSAPIIINCAAMQYKDRSGTAWALGVG